ncbi:protein C1orf43 homolog isoform X2 [Lampris incognitus]|uniref:protein C1orf43 homolog isoform X2 n=1 Tax=Lampris incognitus TaxID=2546036 RepID=UPI0024B527B7|nr:protein C1orf43 homolog isoform X2 [Lampris incognitus]
MKSRRGPHVPLGHNAPKDLRQEIDSKLNKVQKIHFEPRLLSPEDDRLNCRGRSGCYDYLYRMRALDAIRDTDLPFRELGGTPTAITGKRFRTWLLELRNSNALIHSNQSSLIDTVLEGYNNARHGAEVFGEAEFLKYQEALTELASCEDSHQQHHAEPASPVRSQRLDWRPGAFALPLLPHPNHAAYSRSAAAQQAGEALPGAQELQGQLQHTGELVLSQLQLPANRKAERVVSASTATSAYGWGEGAILLDSSRRK